MNRLRDSFAFKTILYLLMLILILITALAVMASIFNASYSWYTKSESQVKENIYGHTAGHTFDLLENALETELQIAAVEETPIVNDTENTEFILGESSSEHFGYTVYAADPTQWGFSEGASSIIREVNSGIKSQEGVYTESFSYEIYGSEETSLQNWTESPDEAITFTIEVFFGDPDEGGVPDEVRSVYDLDTFIYQYRVVALAAAILGFLASLSILIFLMATIGKKEKEHSLMVKLPMDLVTLSAGLLLFFMALLIYSDASYQTNYDALIALVSILVIIVSTIITGYLLIFTVQLKAGGWIRRTVIYQLICGLRWILIKCGHFLKKVPMVWKTSLFLAICLCYSLISIAMGMSYYSGLSIFLWIVGAVVISIVVLHTAVCLKKLKETGRHLAEGDFEYQMDKKGMFLDLAEHADNLNSIGAGMSHAIEEKMKSERFKTELITNVSHDIKTPLTSIINYADFLKKEEIDNEKAKEYIEVIDRQARRLKKLTEDVVDASKAATGNIQIELKPCRIGILMTQVMGEYQEKAEAEGLELILDLPDEDVEILADGRCLWRVFDNLLSNICKYSQPGTRVYQTLEMVNGKVVITYKNTSKYRLNISEDELMERFTRGDRSRHTEGSGLGLSIARNLVELQNGTFTIEIDGDLFKVTNTFDALR